MTPLKKAKFWPYIRPLIWQKAQELYQEECCKTMGEDFSGVTATKAELKEGGYMHTAKLLVLDELWRQKKGRNQAQEDTNPC